MLISRLEAKPAFQFRGGGRDAAGWGLAWAGRFFGWAIVGLVVAFYANSTVFLFEFPRSPAFLALSSGFVVHLVLLLFLVGRKRVMDEGEGRG